MNEPPKICRICKKPCHGELCRECYTQKRRRGCGQPTPLSKRKKCTYEEFFPEITEQIARKIMFELRIGK